MQSYLSYFNVNQLNLLIQGRLQKHGAVLVVISLLIETNGFYVPGVAPVEFKKGQKIDVKAVKMTSIHTQLPYEYYSLPFCRPKKEIFIYKSENLGEVLRGDRYNSILSFLTLGNFKIVFSLTLNIIYFFFQNSKYSI